MSNCKPKLHGDLHTLLLAVEAGHKADILTYCAGHLGPHSLTPKKHPQDVKTTAQPFWRSSEGRKAAPSPQTLLQRQKKAHLVAVNAKTTDTSLSEVIHSTAVVGSNGSLSEQEDSSHSTADTSQRHLVQTESPGLEGDGTQHSGCSSHPLLLNTRQELWEPKCIMTGRGAAEMHQRKLERELQKQCGPSGDRLAVYSDVFDDVCDSSRIFGGILREIKVDYDLYLNETMASQSYLQDKFKEPMELVPAEKKRVRWFPLDSNDMLWLRSPLEDWDHGVAAMEKLEKAEEEVCSLEDEAMRALKENQRVRTEFQNVPSIRIPEDRGVHQETVLPGPLQDDGTAVCYTNMVQSKRLQVWKVWEEIQQLQKEMKEEMMPVVTTTATQRCIQDAKIEMMRLRVSNDRFRNINKELENHIDMLLGGDNVNKAMRKEVWDKIWSVLPSESE